MCMEKGARLVDRVTLPEFGHDAAASYGRINKTFAALVIGPESEWDSVIVKMGGDELILSVEHPLYIGNEREVILRPHRTRDLASSGLVGKLDVLALDSVPASWPGYRPPRHYARASHTTTVGEAVVRTVITAGARAFSMFLENADSSVSAQWRLVGVKALGSGAVDEFPISPSGYADTAATFNTLAADSHEAWHLEVGVDQVDAVRLYAKAASGFPLRHRFEVRDR
jgi:hypothetical protein